MERILAEASTSLVLKRPPSRQRSVAAILVVVFQLLFVGLVPAADARASEADAGTTMGVHVEKPGVHHRMHDSEDCVFCIALQLGAAPAAAAAAPEAGAPERLVTVQLQPTTPPTLPFASQVARAPPAA